MKLTALDNRLVGDLEQMRDYREGRRIVQGVHIRLTPFGSIGGLSGVRRRRPGVVVGAGRERRPGLGSVCDL
jgi:hypothetical protein